MQGYPQDIAIPSANLVSNQCAIDIQNKFLRGCTDVTIDREALVFIQGRKVVNRGGARATVQNPRSQSLVSPNLFDIAPADQFQRLLCAMPDWAKTGGHILCWFSMLRQGAHSRVHRKWIHQLSLWLLASHENGVKASYRRPTKEPKSICA